MNSESRWTLAGEQEWIDHEWLDHTGKRQAAFQRGPFALASYPADEHQAEPGIGIIWQGEILDLVPVSKLQVLLASIGYTLAPAEPPPEGSSDD